MNKLQQICELLQVVYYMLQQVSYLLQQLTDPLDSASVQQNPKTGPKKL